MIKICRFVFRTIRYCGDLNDLNDRFTKMGIGLLGNKNKNNNNTI